jgi:hypothetical protein
LYLHQARGVELKKLKKQLKELETLVAQGGAADRSHHSYRERPDSVATGEFSVLYYFGFTHPFLSAIFPFFT